MAISVSVQYSGVFLPDIILLTQCYFHQGTCMAISVSVQYSGVFLPDIILLTLCDYIGEPLRYHETFLF